MISFTLWSVVWLVSSSLGGGQSSSLAMVVLDVCVCVCVCVCMCRTKHGKGLCTKLPAV